MAEATSTPRPAEEPRQESEFLAAQPDVVERLRADLPDDEALYDLAELFRVFADSTRVKILYALFESELCVGDIALLLNLSQSSVSHQLRILKAASWSSSGGRAKPSSTRWTTTMCAASSPWAWST